MKNYQCKTCGLCMAKSFKSEHRWLTGHKEIIEKDVKEIADEILSKLSDHKNAIVGRSRL